MWVLPAGDLLGSAWDNFISLSCIHCLNFPFLPNFSYHYQ